MYDITVVLRVYNAQDIVQWAVLKVTETGFTKMFVTALIIVRLL